MAAVVELDDEGDALWRALLTSWDDGGQHDRFVGHCFSRGRLAAAGARYRRYGQDHPGDEKARQMLKRVVFLSTQALSLASQRPAGARFLGSRGFAFTILLAAVVGALLGIVYGGRP